MGDAILERNICFVDTPGYSNGTSVSLSTQMLILMLIISVHGMYNTSYGIRRGSVQKNIVS
jgi:hypothetical protein